ncbi:protein NO VEIN domain-containing protein [Marinobacter xestospongiae]|uniref:DUF3883 domain-containing protein n=1 Tax=Marinobacter xestospongiae TaxID=994319 RepID=A0ABU3W3X9_9GAMM|nr:DUF3883 domain-containing protein [Marinobacter xestospongiae]MDV2081237.1 DUF3883 domain-containing protein [Marinobacter xestospongiae]
MKYLFCNTGWMESYQGNGKLDKILGGGSYVIEEGMGHEVCNFHGYRGNVYGYVQPARGHRSASEGSIKLENIVNGGASKNDELIKDVLVIWTATRPEGGTVVVGWYKEATVYREYQYFKSAPVLHSKNGLEGYRIIGRSKNAMLLPVDERVIQIPRKTKGGIGQSNVWYGDSKIGREIAIEVNKVAGGKKICPKPESVRNIDPEHNSKVEKNAIKAVWKYYEDLGYTLESVEKDNVGWDLEASQNKTKLRIEVKGLSGESPCIELSPNEYKAWSEKKRYYRLAVVTCALSSPRLHICRYSQEEGGWQVSSHEGATLKVVEKVAAQVKLNI